MKKIFFALLLLPCLLRGQAGPGRTFDLTGITVVAVIPTLTLTPTSTTGLTSTAGTQGGSASWTAAWSNWTAAADTITAPSGFVVSLDNSTFAGSVKLTTSGTSGSASVYVALASANTAASYFGNVTHVAGTSSVNEFVSGTTSSSGGTAHYRAITVPTSSVGSADLDSFPVMVFGTLSYLATVANGGKVQNANGYDIYFSSDAAGTNILPFERVTWTAASGACQFAVNVPILSHTSTSTFYMQYGSTSITTDQSNVHAAWNNAYTGVYHMETTITGASQASPDATRTGRTLGSYGTWVSGDQGAAIVGGGLTCNGGLFNFTAWTTGTTYTIEGWYKTTVASNTTHAVGNSTGNQDINNFGGAWHLFNGTSDVIATTSTQTTGTWVYSAFTVNGTNAAAYYNGASQATTTTAGVSLTFSALGGYSGGFSSTMTFDEVRLSTVARAPGWIAAEYLNMNAPNTFYSIGAEN